MTRPINSICKYCGEPQLWAYLVSAKKQVPLDRSLTGLARLVRTEQQLMVEFMSQDELAVVMEQQRAARDAGERPEQLYTLHPGECRAKARAAPKPRRPRRPRKGVRR